ncbi:MAG: hypothetical protein QM504_14225 [Pseudomonadota bacterium]
MNKENIINLNTVKQQSNHKKRLEMIVRDSLDNIEDYGFEMFFNCDIDSIIDYTILPYQLPCPPSEQIKVSA